MSHIAAQTRHAVHRLAQRFRRHERLQKERAEFQRLCAAHGIRPSWRNFLEAKEQTGCSVREYFLFRFYERPAAVRATFMTTAQRDAFVTCIGDDLSCNTSAPGNKILFNMLFAPYLGREWLNPTAASPEEFAAFVKRHGRVMVKPAGDGQGKGIFVYAYESDEAAKALHEALADKAMLVEQMPAQHPQLDRLNPNCLNTVRFTTYTDRDAAHILMATLRSATDESAVDNFHAGGIAMAVDLDTGRVVSDGVDEEGRRFSAHPHTRVPLHGFQLPNWREALSVVRRASREMYNLPRCRFLGWDIAFLRSDQIAVIECNWQQGMQTQAPHDHGFRLALKALEKGR